MFVGHVTLGDSLLEIVFVPMMTFVTLVCIVMELQGVNPIGLSILRSVICWPTTAEAIFFPFLLWAFRIVERIIGHRQLVCYMVYNFIIYAPVWLFCMLWLAWHQKIALLYFYPYGLFVFVMYHVPAFPMYLALTDKLLIVFVFGLTMIIHFPYSLVPLATSIIGHFCWTCDVFGWRVFAKERIPDEGREIIPMIDRYAVRLPEGALRVPEIGFQRESRDVNVSVIMEMGFGEDEAVRALLRGGNQLGRAIEYLLSR